MPDLNAVFSQATDSFLEFPFPNSCLQLQREVRVRFLRSPACGAPDPFGRPQQCVGQIRGQKLEHGEFE
jgi:hypothetical protein